MLVMFVEEAIALRAAEARKREASDLRAQAAKFIDLNKTIPDATDESNSLTQSQQLQPRLIAEANARLAQLKQCEPQVLDSTVFIYPVRIRD